MKNFKIKLFRRVGYEARLGGHWNVSEQEPGQQHSHGGENHPDGVFPPHLLDGAGGNSERDDCLQPSLHVLPGAAGPLQGQQLPSALRNCV